MLSTIILFIYFNLFGYYFLELNTDIMAPYQCHICPCQSNIQGVNTVVYSTVKIHVQNQHTLKRQIFGQIFQENSEDPQGLVAVFLLFIIVSYYI